MEDLQVDVRTGRCFFNSLFERGKGWQMALGLNDIWVMAAIRLALLVLAVICKIEVDSQLESAPVHRSRKNRRFHYSSGSLEGARSLASLPGLNLTFLPP